MNDNDAFVIIAVCAIVSGVILFGGALLGPASFVNALKLWSLWNGIAVSYLWLGTGKPPWKW